MVRWRGTRPTAVNHNAYVTTDSEATRHFYEDIIGLPLIATWTEEDQMPDRVRTYCHTMYGLDDGSALAFFQWLDPDAETLRDFLEREPLFDDESMRLVADRLRRRAGSNDANELRSVA